MRNAAAVVAVPRATASASIPREVSSCVEASVTVTSWSRSTSPRAGGVPIVSSSGCRRACLVEGAVAEHGVQDVAAASREAGRGGVVLLAGAAVSAAVGACGGGGQRGGRGQAARPAQLRGAAPAGVF